MTGGTSEWVLRFLLGVVVIVITNILVHAFDGPSWAAAGLGFIAFLVVVYRR